MPSQETLLTIILVAITLNLSLAVGILLAFRRRANARRSESSVREASRPPRPAMPSLPSGGPRSGGSLHGRYDTDLQTGLDLGATWDRWLVEEDARIRRYRRPVTIVIVEAEGLDRLTERLGSVVGDRLVPPIATTLRRHAREADRIARLGPARFGVILPETDEVQAIHYVERVRDAADLWLQAGAVAVRLVAGWAEANAGRGADAAAMLAADRLDADRRRLPASPEETDIATSRVPQPAVG